MADGEALTANLLAKYENFFNPGIARLISVVMPAVEDRTEGMYMYDAEGHAYLDFLGGHGVFNVGHRHPRVLAAVRSQLDRAPLSASKVVLSEPLATLCERLASITPGDLSRAFICNSGTEAVEAALKLARAYTGKPGIIAAHGAFHGKSMGSLSATGRQVYRQPFEPLVPAFTHVPFGDAAAVSAAIGADTAAVIVEPIQGEGGVIVPPDGYLKDLRALGDKRGVLLIFDEIQTGLGRTGRMFACNYEGVAPDIMTLAKALGGGVMPIGAMVATPEVFTPFEENPFLHTSTFGGNPLACAAAVAAIDVIVKDKLSVAAEERGRFLLDRLEELKEKHPGLIVDVRGKGLLAGLEVINEGVAGSVIYELDQARILVLQMLNNPKVIRLEPPLIVTDRQIESLVESLDQALARSADLVDSTVS